MSKKEVLKAEEAVEVMQSTGVPAQETEEVSTALSLYKNEKCSRDCTERSTEVRRYVQ